MKYQVKKIPPQSGSCELAVVFISTDAQSEIIHPDQNHLPTDLNEKINQSLSLIDFRNERIKFRLFYFPDHTIKRIMLVKAEPEVADNRLDLYNRTAEIFDEINSSDVKQAHLYGLKTP